MIDFSKIKRVHFIGVGGIGISALARMFLAQGAMVSGSDSQENLVIEQLKQANLIFYNQHSFDNIQPDIDLVIYTIAITADNSELLRAQELKIKTMTYPEALGVLSAQRKTIAIAGTHGKTTTTAMIAKIAIDNDLKPTVIVGSLLAEGQTNFIAGQSDLFIVEACEYRRSFLNLQPDILIITNIEEEHLDYYRDLTDILEAFDSLIKKLPATGVLIANPNDPNLKKIIKANSVINILDYTQAPLADFPLKVFGQHNLANAQAAITLAQFLNLPFGKIKKSLSTFKGIWRRLDYYGEVNGALVYDDYAHHPTEIKMTLGALRQQFPQRKIIAIFQPHLYSRTKKFQREFIQSLSLADQVILLPIYASREQFDSSISSALLKKDLKNSILFDDFSTVINFIKEKASKNDLIITLGAGNIYEVAAGVVA